MFDEEKIEEKGPEIYGAAVKMIVQYGMDIGDGWSLDRLAENDGMTVKGSKIFFSEELVRERVPFGPGNEGLRFDCFETAFNSRAAKRDEEKPYHCQVGGFAMSVYDLEKRDLRASTMADAVEAVQLCHALGIGGPYPCTPTDVPPMMRNIMCHRVCFENSDHCSTHVNTGENQSQPIYDMHQVMGVQMPITLTAVTPFRIEHNNLGVIRDFVKKGVKGDSLRIVPVGYGLSGMNYPLTLAGAWALCLAEHMGQYLVATGLNTGFDIGPSVGPVDIPPVNLQDFCLACGYPSQSFHYVVNHIWSHAVLGRDWRAAEHAEIGMWTGSPVPDGQAAAEKTTIVLAALMDGARRFGRLGNLCVDDVFSCEQLLLDLDILEHTFHAVHAGDQIDAYLDMENLMKEVADVVSGEDSFSMVPSTLEHLRTLYPRSTGRFIRKKRTAVADTSMDRLLFEQAERKAELLKGYDYELSDDKRKALADIYDAAAQQVE